MAHAATRSSRGELGDRAPHQTEAHRVTSRGLGGESVVEKVEDGGPKEAECLAGERACPPDDCGGPWGYADFCAAVTDPNHEQHADLTEWAGIARLP